jgi:hypothetical protein
MAAVRRRSKVKLVSDFYEFGVYRGLRSCVIAKGADVAAEQRTAASCHEGHTRGGDKINGFGDSALSRMRKLQADL